MPFDRIWIMLDGWVKLTVFNIDWLDTVLGFSSLEFIIEHFFQAHAIVIQKHVKAVHFAAVTNRMVDVAILLS